MIRHAVREHYSDPDERLVTDYLDKMVQISIRVPRVGVEELKAYMFLLFAEIADIDANAKQTLQESLIDGLRNVWKGEPIAGASAASLIGIDGSHILRNEFDMAERLAPILATTPNVAGNPRIVKRLLNTIRIRSNIASRRGMAIDDAVITKLAVLERCTSDRAFGEFCQLINAAPNGQPSEIKAMEHAAANDSDFSTVCPEPLKDYSSFLKVWCTIQPSLADRDLRPVIYLSRDVAPVRASTKGLSADSEGALNALLLTSALNSPAAKQAAISIPDPECEAVMAALISELRKVDNWTSRPKAFSGAVILGDERENTRSDLKRFVATLPENPRPLWLKQVIERRVWLQKGGTD